MTSEYIVAATASVSGIDFWQAVGLFAGIPLVIVLVVFAACYLPRWAESLRVRRERRDLR